MRGNSATQAIPVQWDGEAFRPARRFENYCDSQFVVGERYSIEVIDQVQAGRDKAYHASLREAWKNLPDQFDGQFPHPDDFRAYCLIKCGFCTISRIACASPKAASEALPTIQPEGFCITHVEGAVITVIKPLSQKMRGGMSKEDRLRSYTETLNFAAGLVGVKSEELETNAENHS